MWDIRITMILTPPFQHVRLPIGVRQCEQGEGWLAFFSYSLRFLNPQGKESKSTEAGMNESEAEILSSNWSYNKSAYDTRQLKKNLEKGYFSFQLTSGWNKQFDQDHEIVWHGLIINIMLEVNVI